MNEYLGILIMFVLAAAVGGAFIVLASVLGPKAPTPAKSEPFECGEEPFKLPGGRFSVKFYLVAMLFILFDVELVFLFPWAVVYRYLGMAGFLEMAVFMGIVVAGFLYAWKKGALEWQ
ncbi:MAG: NADH-quinone oxidoreductase subunit A [Candidatus Omnitrophica bacterium]|nr:NADH-quinone oxidoreductase subunit A [Candidatus Omnitrophota bacterium]